MKYSWQSRNASTAKGPLIQYQKKWIKLYACQGILWNICGHHQEKLSSTYKVFGGDIPLEYISAGRRRYYGISNINSQASLLQTKMFTNRGASVFHTSLLPLEIRGWDYGEAFGSHELNLGIWWNTRNNVQNVFSFEVVIIVWKTEDEGMAIFLMGLIKCMIAFLTFHHFETWFSEFCNRYK